MKLIPYLAFNGQCEEALTFYRDCLNGNIERTMYYSNDQDIGMEIPDHMVGQVMNMALTIGDDAIMGSDHFEPVSKEGNITLNMEFSQVDELESVFEVLSEGGEVTMPLQDTFWDARFGTLTDKFGIRWMLNCYL